MHMQRSTAVVWSGRVPPPTPDSFTAASPLWVPVANHPGCILQHCLLLHTTHTTGAGMDTRAWRLQWPAGFSVFEVDSQQVLDFKHRILQGAAAAAPTMQAASSIRYRRSSRRVGPTVCLP